MIECPRCGRENNEKQPLCVNCGECLIDFNKMTREQKLEMYYYLNEMVENAKSDLKTGMSREEVENYYKSGFFKSKDDYEDIINAIDSLEMILYLYSPMVNKLKKELDECKLYEKREEFEQKNIEWQNWVEKNFNSSGTKTNLNNIRKNIKNSNNTNTDANTNNNNNTFLIFKITIISILATIIIFLIWLIKKM